MDQRVMAAKQFVKNQAKKVTEYFKPTERVRARDVIREVPGAVGQVFSGTRDTAVKGGKILGEGLAYATSKNVRDQYKAGNTDILPTVSNTSPRQMLGTTAKSAMEILPVGKVRGLAKAAMSAKLAPRMAAGGAMGYGYGVADEMSRPEAISEKTFAGPNPILSALGGALFGGMSRPTSEILGQAGKEIANDIRTINPANRMTHRVVDKYDMEPVPGVFAPGGVQQQRPIMESFRKEVETTQNPYNPQSSLVKFFLGKQAPVGMSIKAVDDPLLQEARKYKSAEEFVNSFNLMKSGEVTSIGQLPISKVNKTQIRAITERGLPHTDTGLKVKDFTPGRKVTQPLEVYSKGGSYVVENGNHRLAQALANGDTHIPVVFKRGEGKTYSTHTKSQLTDLYNQATKK